MELSLVSDALTSIISTQAGSSLGFSRLIASSGQSLAGSLQISAKMLPFDAVAPPPPVRSSRVKTLPRRQLKQRRRTRKRSSTSDDDGGCGDEIFGFFAGDCGDGDGSFNNNDNGGGGGYGGGSWNFGWDEFFSNNGGGNNSYHDPAFDFVYEVLSWIVLSNCLHFAYNKLVRIVTDGLNDPAREKVALRLEAVC